MSAFDLMQFFFRRIFRFFYSILLNRTVKGNPGNWTFYGEKKNVEFENNKYVWKRLKNQQFLSFFLFRSFFKFDSDGFVQRTAYIIFIFIWIWTATVTCNCNFAWGIVSQFLSFFAFTSCSLLFNWSFDFLHLLSFSLSLYLPHAYLDKRKMSISNCCSFFLCLMNIKRKISE